MPTTTTPFALRAAVLALAPLLALPAYSQDAADAPPLRTMPRMAPLPRGDVGKALPSVLYADELRGRPDLDAVASGDVEFRRGGIVIEADELSYNSPDDLARARGNVRIEQDGNVFTGTELQLHVQSFEGWFLEPTYFFGLIGAGGRAERIDFVDSQRARLIGATYTSCRPDGAGAPDWLLSAASVKVDMETQEGVAEGAVLRFLGVPILALPRFTFPLSDARKSGWLPPTLHIDSRSGLGILVPYYWNIAPQRDATIAPLLLSRRGVGVDTEFRYLEPQHRGTMNYHLIPHDSVAGRSRYSLRLANDGTLPMAVDYRVRATRASDDEYWKNFPRLLRSITPRLLATDVSALRGFARFSTGLDDFALYARVQRWQVLRDPDPAAAIIGPYQREPQIGARLLQRLAGGFDVALETEFNRFTLPSGEPSARPTGNRLHALGSISRPWLTSGWSLTPRLTLNAATYQTDQPLANGSDRASRVIPTFSVDSGWLFERDSAWFGRTMRQTLEPRLLYVNTPLREQDDIPNFDAAPKDFNFESIYSDNAFSGIDRVSDANQITAGVTTRLLDPQSGVEALRLGIVQRYLLRDQRITPDRQPLTQRFSDLLLLGSSTLVPRWWLDGSLQYNPETERATRSILGVRYSPRPFRTLSVRYRFTRDLSEQVALAWQWPIFGVEPQLDEAQFSPVARALQGGRDCAGTWYTVGRVAYSIRDSRVTDSIFGLEYDAGCWITRVVVERLSTGRSEATTRFLLQLELVGLSRIGSNPLQILRANIPGYRLLREPSTTRSAPGFPNDSYDSPYE